jgi:hypothetical protein
MLGRVPRRSSLKPQLNQIRTWTRQGRTDIWIAHTLESTPESIRAFRLDNGLLRPGEAAPAPAPESRTNGDAPSTRRRRRTKAAAPAEAEAPTEPAPEPEAEVASAPKSPRRRGGRRGRSGGAQTEEPVSASIVRGVAIQLPESVLADPSFKEHWNGVQAVTAEIGPETIVLRRA